MARVIGIDLGTTNSVVATLQMGGCRILQNREGEEQTPSVVCFARGEYLVGSVARQRLPMSPEDTIYSVKRLIGRGISDPHVKKMISEGISYRIVEPSDGTTDSLRVLLGGKEHSPIDISSRVLKKLKSDAEFVLGEEVEKAVITVPAYFSEKQKHATREAGKLAGLKVMKVLDEPTAAAIAFGLDSADQEPKTVLVFDLGGGTFDISILMMAGATFAPMNLEGDMWLGGDNFDQLIVDHVVDRISAEYGIDPRQHSRFMATLKQQAQKAKEALSSSRFYEIIIPALLQDKNGQYIDIDIDISREQFEAMIDPLIERTLSLAKKAVENAGFGLDQVDHVLMAGNSTAIPKIHEAIDNLFGKERVSRKVHPKKCVAIGAAMTAAMLEPVWRDDQEGAPSEPPPKEGTDQQLACPACKAPNPAGAEKCQACGTPFIEVPGGIAPFHYGIQTADDSFNIFIRKNDPCPTPEADIQIQTFRTAFANQRILSIPVYGGTHEDKASLNEKQGVAYSFLPEGCPKGTAVKIKLWLDPSGVFLLDAFLDDGRNLEDVILRGDLDQKTVDTFVRADEQVAKRKGDLPADERAKVEEQRGEIIKMMEKRDFQIALQKAEEYAQMAAETKEPSAPVDPMAQAEGLLNTVAFVCNEYSWLLGASAYKLGSEADALRQAVAEKNEARVKELLPGLEKSFNDLVEQQQLLKLLFGIRIAIVTRIRGAYPAEANQYLQQLGQIEAALKNKERDAQIKLKTFVEDLGKFLEDHPDPDKVVVCASCGHKNPAGPHYCEKCEADLWMIGGKEAISSGDWTLT